MRLSQRCRIAMVVPTRSGIICYLFVTTAFAATPSADGLRQTLRRALDVGIESDPETTRQLIDDLVSIGPDGADALAPDVARLLVPASPTAVPPNPQALIRLA